MKRPLLRQLLQAPDLHRDLEGHGLQGAAVPAKAALLVRAAQALLVAGREDGHEVRAFFVPGRIEVLGKHTDYAGGSSIVAAAEQGFGVVVARRSDARIVVRSVDLGEETAFPYDPELEPARGHWTNYPMTVARRLARNFPGRRPGVEMAFASDLTPAAGMSSSSALVIASFLGLSAFDELPAHPLYRANIPDPLSLAAYLGTHENGQSFGPLEGDQGVGTFGGSEDHTAILCSEPGALGQFAYCPTRFERRLPVPVGWVFAIGCSGVAAEKTGAAQKLYNRASSQVAAVVAAWRAETGSGEAYLADILGGRPGVVDDVRRVLDQGAGLPCDAEALRRRLDHFILENEEIIPAAGDALAQADLESFGRLVDRSQEGAESLLGNQVPETAFLARAARAAGAAAASAFGAGFGGGVWALVPSAGAAEFLPEWSGRYADAFPGRVSASRFFLTQAGPAAFELTGPGSVSSPDRAS